MTIKTQYPTFTNRILSWIEESLLLSFVPTVLALSALAHWGFKEAFFVRELPFVGVLLIWGLVVLGVILAGPSIFGLVSYIIFLPSASKGGHLLVRVHARHIIHPMNSALVLAVLAMAIMAQSAVVWGLWIAIMAAYLLQTILMLRVVLADVPPEDQHRSVGQTLSLLPGLLLGGELVAMASGARALSPWRIHALPEDTWIVDVRTKPEFHWNRLAGAENYPWGAGIAAAAEAKPKDRPVLVTCLSGHRSPAVAAMIRRMGFTEVYNLNWGILYLIVLERGQKRRGGPFALTRAHRDPHRRGNDLKAITISHVTVTSLALVGAPLEAAYVDRHLPDYLFWVGAGLGGLGLLLGVLSFRALGRNFRVFAAPRRSGTLVTGGIYSKVRHPMYTGVIVGLGGYVLMFGSLYCVPLWVAVTALYVVKSIKEEHGLAAKFPDYEDYRKRTWRLVPYVF